MGKCVMIVDDSSSVRTVVGIALRGAGYEVLEASDGADALKKLGGQKIHLIISDVNMPVMDGIEATRRIREVEQRELTPPDDACHIVEVTGERCVRVRSGMIFL